MTSNQLDPSVDVLNPVKIRDDIEALTSKLNIKKWDLGASSSKDISVQVFKGEAKQLKSSQRSSITLRVWNNENLLGITSTSDLSPKGLADALKTAWEASHFGNKKETPQFSPLSTARLANIKRPIINSSGVKTLFNRLLDAESKLLAKHKSINSVPYNGFSELDYERLYLNSQGSHRFHRNTQCSLYLYAKGQEENRKPRTGGSIKIGHGYSDIDVEECIEEAASRTISHLNYEPIITDKYLVCFSPEAFLDLIYAFSNIFNARSVLDGVSLSTKDTLGTQIASPILKLTDDGLHPSNVGAISFDGEGTPTRETITERRNRKGEDVYFWYLSPKLVDQFNLSNLPMEAVVAEDPTAIDWVRLRFGGEVKKIEFNISQLQESAMDLPPAPIVRDISVN